MRAHFLHFYSFGNINRDVEQFDQDSIVQGRIKNLNPDPRILGLYIYIYFSCLTFFYLQRIKFRKKNSYVAKEESVNSQYA